MYVIVGPKGYVAKPGHITSYVKDVRLARKFETIEHAERNRCPENERIVDLERELDQFRR